MQVKYSLLALAGAMALVGAGCSSTTGTDVSTSSDTITNQNSDKAVVQEENVEAMNSTSEEVTNTGDTMVVVNYNVGDAVMVDLGYGWYEGKVADFQCDAGVYVQYRGLSASCITEDKLVKPVAPSTDVLVIGAKVIANIGKGEMFGGKTIYPYYSGEITAVKGSTYTVTDSNNKTYDLSADKIYLK